MMLALSLHRPWPWAFFHLPPEAAKPVENRGWKMPPKLAGQIVALHAAKAFDEQALVDFRAGRFGEAATAVPATQHPTGVIGVVVFEDCVHINDIDRVDPLACTWSFGPWCWRVRPGSVRALAAPVPCRGLQMVWGLPLDVEAAVRLQLGAG